MADAAKAPAWGLRFLDRPTRILFFTGKGGVGKTSLACAAAVALADGGSCARRSFASAFSGVRQRSAPPRSTAWRRPCPQDHGARGRARPDRRDLDSRRPDSLRRECDLICWRRRPGSRLLLAFLSPAGGQENDEAAAEEQDRAAELECEDATALSASDATIRRHGAPRHAEGISLTRSGECGTRSSPGELRAIL
jgi:Mrp family chromosome partitioning ATPase